MAREVVFRTPQVLVLARAAVALHSLVCCLGCHPFLALKWHQWLRGTDSKSFEMDECQIRDSYR
jgi:hypothetical protein